MQKGIPERLGPSPPSFTLIGTISLILALFISSEAALLKYAVLAIALVFYLLSVVRYFRRPVRQSASEPEKMLSE